MTSFIVIKNKTVTKLPVYFNSHMRIVGQIIYILYYMVSCIYRGSLCMQTKHQNVRFVVLQSFFIRKKITFYRL